MQVQRILVVDDEDTVRNVVSRHLARQGYEVATAPDGVTALEAFESQPFDMVITDLNMPRMGGAELIGRLKADSPGIMVIVLTGYGDMNSAIEVLRRGCDDYLLKPLPDINIVSRAVEQCLARRRALLMAASHRKLSQAKDKILSLIITEFGGRLADLSQVADTIASACTCGEVEAALEQAEKLTVMLEKLEQELEDARTVSCTVRDDVLEVPGDRVLSMQ
jgi:CheY-like chemotaxis protein